MGIVWLASAWVCQDGWRSTYEPPPPRGEIVRVAAVAPSPAPVAAANAPVVAPPPSRPETLGPGMRIDLPGLIARALADHPDAAAAAANARAAAARADAESRPWLPNVRLGVSYNRHAGQLQNIQGVVASEGRTAFQAGFGAGSSAAGTPPIAGAALTVHAADALWKPRAARATALAERHAADRVCQELQYAAAEAYIALQQAVGATALLDEALERQAELVRLTGAFAKTGAGLPADADRAVAEARLLEVELADALRGWKVASARVAALHGGEPGTVFLPAEESVAPLPALVGTGDAATLTERAWRQRPELAEAQQLVAAACARRRREQAAPLLPTLGVAASYSGFGGSPGSRVANFGERGDLDAFAFWELRQLGAGDAAARREQSARVEQAQARQLGVMRQVAREVAEALADENGAEARRNAATAAVAAAESAWTRSLKRVAGGEGLPLEAQQSAMGLLAARRALLAAIASGNLAQFRILHATGAPLGAPAESAPLKP